MAKANALRQAEYRKKRAEAGDNGERRVNTWVSTAAALALARLANRYGVTKRELLERLVKIEEESVSKTLELDTPEWDAYFSVER